MISSYDAMQEAEEWRTSLDQFHASYNRDLEDLGVYLDAQIMPEGYCVSMYVTSPEGSAVYVDEYEGFVNDFAFDEFYQTLVRELDSQVEGVDLEAESIFGRW